MFTKTTKWDSWYRHQPSVHIQWVNYTGINTKWSHITLLIILTQSFPIRKKLTKDHSGTYCPRPVQDPLAVHLLNNWLYIPHFFALLYQLPSLCVYFWDENRVTYVTKYKWGDTSLYVNIFFSSSKKITKLLYLQC